MSTQSLSIGPVHFRSPYTGTADNPDVVSIFFKSGNAIKIEDIRAITVGDGRATRREYDPNFYFHNLFLAFEKIHKAVQRIFASITGNNNDLWNGLKNLGRGLVQLVPLAGNAALYLFDKIKTNFYTHPQIKAALANENEPLLGFAFDGKVISQFSRNEVEAFFRAQLDDPLERLSAFWTDMLKLECRDNITRLQLATDLANRIRQRAQRNF